MKVGELELGWTTSLNNTLNLSRIEKHRIICETLEKFTGEPYHDRKGADFSSAEIKVGKTPIQSCDATISERDDVLNKHIPVMRFLISKNSATLVEKIYPTNFYVHTGFFRP